jgi:tetratricopeptide (TPR) repeat protein
MRHAISTLERAVALDPSYAPAWADLAQSYFDLYDFGFAPAAENLPKARAAAEKALALAPAYGPAHWALGWVKMYGDNDWPGARAELDAARRADPTTPQPDWLRLYAGCLSGPCYEEFVRDLSRDIDRDPLNPARYVLRGTTHYRAGEQEAAERDLRHALDLSPNLVPARFALAQVLILRRDFAGALATANAAPEGFWGDATRVLAYDALGRRSEADRLLQGTLTRGSFVSPYIVARIYVARGNRASALDWLDRGYMEKDHFMLWLQVDPAWKTLADAPRFKALLLKMNFPES